MADRQELEPIDRNTAKVSTSDVTIRFLPDKLQHMHRDGHRTSVCMEANLLLRCGEPGNVSPLPRNDL